MQQMIRIRGIEEVAAKYRVTLAELCRRASVPYSTVYRWKTGETMPRLDTFEEFTSALDIELAKIQASMKKLVEDEARSKDEADTHPRPAAVT